MKRLGAFIACVFLLISISGCVALLAGAAGGIGTATWLSGKLSQDVNSPFDNTLSAAKKALKSLNLKVKKETVGAKVAQVLSDYADGRNIWIDIRRVSDSASQVEVRVGAAGDKEAAQKIIDRILKYL